MSDPSYFLWKVSGIQLINCLEVGPYPARLFSQPKFTRNILATIGKSVNTGNIRGPFEKVSCKSNFNKTSEWTFLVLWFKISRYFMA